MCEFLRINYLNFDVRMILLSLFVNWLSLEKSTQLFGFVSYVVHDFNWEKLCRKL